MIKQQIQFKSGDIWWINYAGLTESKIVRVVESHGVRLIVVRIKTGSLPLFLGMKKTFTLDEFWDMAVKA